MDIVDVLPLLAFDVVGGAFVAVAVVADIATVVQHDVKAVVVNDDISGIVGESTEIFGFNIPF